MRRGYRKYRIVNFFFNVLSHFNREITKEKKKQVVEGASLSFVDKCSSKQSTNENAREDKYRKGVSHQWLNEKLFRFLSIHLVYNVPYSHRTITLRISLSNEHDESNFHPRVCFPRRMFSLLSLLAYMSLSPLFFLCKFYRGRRIVCF